MRVNGSWAVVAALAGVLLTACGGGGGGGSDAPQDTGATAAKSASNGVPLSTTRHYRDEWQLSFTQNLQDGSTKAFQSNYRVEAVSPTGNYSLSINTLATDAAPATVATEQYDAKNIRTAFGQCVSTGGNSLPATFSKGDHWTTHGTVSCINTDPVQTDWTVLDERIVVKAGTSLHVYELHRVSTTLPLAANGVLQDPTHATQVDATCLWAPDIGLFISCQSTYAYAETTPASAVVRDSYDLTAFLPNAASAVPPSAPSGTYPAVQAAVPQVGPPALLAQAEVLSAPHLVPVYFKNAPDQDQKTGFLNRLIHSQSWLALKEYGVGAATMGADVPLNVDAADKVQDSEIQALLNAQIANGVIKADPNTFLVLFYPASTTVTAGGASCVRFNAYHAHFKTPAGLRVAYAVVPDCRRGLGDMTTAISHEVLEGVVDPYQTGYRAVQGDFSWAAAFDSAEIGDMCEHNSDLTARENSDVIARVWSNAAAKAGHNPCVPQRSPLQGDVYFNSVPQLDDTVQLVHGGGMGVAKGIVIAPGQSKAIRVRLFSDGPTYGHWNVHATWVKKNSQDASDPPSFEWDRSTGQNGDVLTLTIKAPSKPMPDGALFTIESHYAGMTTMWTGVVANEAATATATVIAGSATQGKADGAGAAAQFGPGGKLTLAADGNSLLVANMNMLRKVGLDGKVTTLSGNGLFANDEVLTTSGGQIYAVGEKGVMPAGATTPSWRRFVQRIDGQGIATTLASNAGSADTVFGGKAGSGGVAMGPDGLLYVASPTENQILVVDPHTGAAATYAGNADGSAGADDGDVSKASFNHPMGLSFDAQGNLYVCDLGNHKIRKITPEGVVSTLAGSGLGNYAGGQGSAAGFGYPSDIVFDPSSGKLYVADSGAIRQLDLEGRVRTVIGGDLGYGFYGLTVDAHGVLYATTVGNVAGVVRINGLH